MTDLWVEATHDAEGDERTRKLVIAREAVVDLFPFLTEAADRTDFDNRKVLVADRLDAAAQKADPDGWQEVRQDLVAAIDADYKATRKTGQATALSDVDQAYKGSYFTIAGAGEPIQGWIDGIEPMLAEKGIGKPTAWYTAKGAQVNAYAGVTSGPNAFQDDLTLLMFPLDGLDGGKLAMFKFQMEARWFDDIIDNMKPDVYDDDDDDDGYEASRRRAQRKTAQDPDPTSPGFSDWLLGEAGPCPFCGELVEEGGDCSQKHYETYEATMQPPKYSRRRASLRRLALTQSEAWEKWPEHKGHNLGASLGNVVCATCGYITLERDTQPPGPNDNEVVHPYFSRRRGSFRKLADTCDVCGDTIEKDPAHEDPQTWHHDNGEKHDHEATPSKGEGDSKESRRRTARLISVRDEYDDKGTLTLWSGGFASDYEGEAVPFEGGYHIDLYGGGGGTFDVLTPHRDGRNYSTVDEKISQAVNDYEATGRFESRRRRAAHRKVAQEKYPDIEVQLVGLDGNAFSILGRVGEALRRGGVSREERDAFMNEATAGDYDQLLQTVMKWVRVSSKQPRVSRRKTAGERRLLRMPFSEVNMHMQIAGKDMWGELLDNGRAVQLYDLDMKPFSFPISSGEAGWGMTGADHTMTDFVGDTWYPIGKGPTASRRRYPKGRRTAENTPNAYMDYTGCARCGHGYGDHWDLAGVYGTWHPCKLDDCRDFEQILTVADQDRMDLQGSQKTAAHGRTWQGVLPSGKQYTFIIEQSEWGYRISMNGEAVAQDGTAGPFNDYETSALAREYVETLITVLGLTPTHDWYDKLGKRGSRKTAGWQQMDSDTWVLMEPEGEGVINLQEIGGYRWNIVGPAPSYELIVEGQAFSIQTAKLAVEMAFMEIQYDAREGSRKTGKKVTQTKANQVLKAIMKQFKPWIDADDDERNWPYVEMDYEGGAAIIWESGSPYDWTLFVPYGGIESEFGFNIPSVTADMPTGVFVEPWNGYVLGLFDDPQQVYTGSRRSARRLPFGRRPKTAALVEGGQYQVMAPGAFLRREDSEPIPGGGTAFNGLISTSLEVGQVITFVGLRYSGGSDGINHSWFTTANGEQGWFTPGFWGKPQDGYLAPVTGRKTGAWEEVDEAGWVEANPSDRDVAVEDNCTNCGETIGWTDFDSDDYGRPTGTFSAYYEKGSEAWCEGCIDRKFNPEHWVGEPDAILGPGHLSRRKTAAEDAYNVFYVREDQLFGGTVTVQVPGNWAKDKAQMLADSLKDRPENTDAFIKKVSRKTAQDDDPIPDLMPYLLPECEECGYIIASPSSHAEDCSKYLADPEPKRWGSRKTAQAGPPEPWPESACGEQDEDTFCIRDIGHEGEHQFRSRFWVEQKMDEAGLTSIEEELPEEGEEQAEEVAPDEEAPPEQPVEEKPAEKSKGVPPQFKKKTSRPKADLSKVAETGASDEEPRRICQDCGYPLDEPTPDADCMKHPERRYYDASSKQTVSS